MPYPNFLLIGANKAGTTSLHGFLDQHPQVFMSAVKEPSYFTKAGQTRAELASADVGRQIARREVTTTLDEYLALFSGATDELVRGESSTAYLSNPSAPARIQEAIPDVKLAAVLRDPIDRAFSAYSMAVRWGAEPLSFADAVAEELAGGEQPTRHYVANGYYGRYLPRYLDRFAHDQIRVYLYEEFEAAPEKVLHDLFHFLEVDADFPVVTQQRANESRTPSRADRLPRPLRRVARAVLPSSLRKQVRVRTAIELADATRATLVELYRPDVAATAELIGRDLSGWLR